MILSIVQNRTINEMDQESMFSCGSSCQFSHTLDSMVNHEPKCGKSQNHMSAFQSIIFFGGIIIPN